MQAQMEQMWQGGEAYLNSLPEETSLGDIMGETYIVETSTGPASFPLPYPSALAEEEFVTISSPEKIR